MNRSQLHIYQKIKHVETGLHIRHTENLLRDLERVAQYSRLSQ